MERGLDRWSRGLTPYVLLTLFAAALYLPGTAAMPPLDRDESRFAQATKQMLETGDFVGIYFQDTPRVKKPVGIHWLQAGSVALLSRPPYNEIWAYRIPSVLGAWAALLLTFGVGRRLFGRKIALVGAAILGSSLLLAAEAQQAKTDAVLLASIIAAQLILARAYLESADAGEERTVEPLPLSTIAVFWSALGLGALLKGPIGPLVTVLTVLALVLAERRARWLLALRPAVGLLVAAAWVAPWSLAVTLSADYDFFAPATSEDLLPKLLSGQEGHGAPPGTHLAAMFVSFWPGSLFVLPAAWLSWRHRKRPAVRFCLAWLIPFWLLLEAVPTKLPHYVLPTYPALALLTAMILLDAEAAKSALCSTAARLGYSVWAAFGLISAAAYLYAPFVFANGLAWWSLPPAIVVCAGASFAFLLAWHRRFFGALIAALASALLLYPWLAEVYAPRLDRLWSSRSLAAAVRRVAETDTPAVAASGYHEPSLVFLLGTQTLLTDPHGAAEFLSRTPRGVAIISDRDRPKFLAAMAEMSLEPSAAISIESFNYSRGKRLTLRLYTPGRRAQHSTLVGRRLE